jgi:thiopeptide-type bacteriocin biosynthesis protein
MVMTVDAPLQMLEDAVLTVLAGAPTNTVAAKYGLNLNQLVDGVDLYRAAGRDALDAAQHHATGWYQVRIEFADWNTAENTVANELRPILRRLEGDQMVGPWWYVRKSPCWRLRLYSDAERATEVRESLDCALDSLVAQRAVCQWRETIYEPETLAFGGPPGIAIAHRLFHADSRAILDHLAATTAPIRRPELSLLLCTALLRGAGQDWHEQGDIWQRVATMREDDPANQVDQPLHLVAAVRRLISLDLNAGHMMDTGQPLAFAAPWLAAFHKTGQHLGAASQHGDLTRGIRDVLAHHVIFHWNRLGLPVTTQRALALAAVLATLHVPADPVRDSTDIISV